MLDWIRENLADEARRIGIDPNRLSFFKRIGGDLSSGGKAIFEVLGPNHPEPLWIVKASRSAEGACRLRSEIDRLESLFDRLPDPLRASIPRPVHFEDTGVGALSIESFLPGERFSRMLRSHQQQDPWGRWSKWGTSGLQWLQDYTEVERPVSFEWNASWWDSQVLLPLEPLAPLLRETSPHWDCVWDALRAARSLVSGSTFRSIPPHGDFTPTNLVWDGIRWGVFDWSPEETGRPPLLDFFHYLMSSALYLSQALERKTSLARLESVCCADDRFLSPVAGRLRWFQTFLKVSHQDLEPLALAAFTLKILGFATRPEPVKDSLAGWILGTGCWVQGNAARRLIEAGPTSR
jgi:hypothetical protein